MPEARNYNSFHFIREWNGWLVCLPRPWWPSKELDILHHFEIRLLWLGRLPCWSSSYNNPYFSKRGPWWFFYLCLQLLMFSFISSITFLIWSISFSKYGTLYEAVSFAWFSGSVFSPPSFWLWASPPVYLSWCCLLRPISLVNS